MNRCLYLGCLLCALSLFTGCDRKALDCSSVSNIGDTSTTNKNFKINFNNDKVSNLFMEVDVILNNTDNTTKESLESSVNNSFGMYKDISGVDYSSIVRDDGFNVKIKFNFDKLSETDKKKISLINSEKNYDSIKNEFESNGFTCK